MSSLSKWASSPLATFLLKLIKNPLVLLVLAVFLIFWLDEALASPGPAAMTSAANPGLDSKSTKS